MLSCCFFLSFSDIPYLVWESLVATDPDHLYSLDNIILDHSIDNTVLIGPNEQEVATSVDLLLSLVACQTVGNKSD